MSVEEVERIMDETQDAIEYQQVNPSLVEKLKHNTERHLFSLKSILLSFHLAYYLTLCVSQRIFL